MSFDVLGPVLAVLVIFAALIAVLRYLKAKDKSFTFRVFTALGLGIVLGAGIQLALGRGSDAATTALDWMSLVGTGYIDLLRMLVMPLVFVAIVGAFTLDPLFGPAEKLGASLETSVEDVLLGAIPDVSFFWGGEDLLSVYCRHAAEQYLDYDSQTASFESEKFLNILTACAAVSSAAPAPDSIMQQPMRSAAMYRSMQISWYQQTGGVFRVLALDSDGGTAYQPVLQLGVCVGSAMREAAAEALRNMLQEDFQLTIADAFPVNRAALRELMQKEIEAQKAEQQTAIREEGRVEIGEAGDLAFLFDEAAADDLMNVLEHADCRSCGNQEILKIILDEADAFFKGRKTAQEAAQVMDRRAALFIAEAG